MCFRFLPYRSGKPREEVSIASSHSIHCYLVFPSRPFRFRLFLCAFPSAHRTRLSLPVEPCRYSDRRDLLSPRNSPHVSCQTLIAPDSDSALFSSTRSRQTFRQCSDKSAATEFLFSQLDKTQALGRRTGEIEASLGHETLPLLSNPRDIGRLWWRYESQFPPAEVPKCRSRSPKKALLTHSDRRRLILPFI